MRARTLLDTRDHSDAVLCGHDGPCDPRNDGDGLIIQAAQSGGRYAPPILCVSLQGPDGCVELTGTQMVRATIEALDRALAAWAAEHVEPRQAEAA